VFDDTIGNSDLSSRRRIPGVSAGESKTNFTPSDRDDVIASGDLNRITNWGMY
jgi:hypothetical protein